MFVVLFIHHFIKILYMKAIVNIVVGIIIAFIKRHMTFLSRKVKIKKANNNWTMENQLSCKDTSNFRLF